MAEPILKSEQVVRPTPDPKAQPFEGDDPVGVWVGICPVYGWDHAVVFNDPMLQINCPHCWRFWGDELACEIRHYDSEAGWWGRFGEQVGEQVAQRESRRS